jgi:hypothetical protein
VICLGIKTVWRDCHTNDSIDRRFAFGTLVRGMTVCRFGVLGFVTSEYESSRFCACHRWVGWIMEIVVWYWRSQSYALTRRALPSCTRECMAWLYANVMLGICWSGGADGRGNQHLRFGIRALAKHKYHGKSKAFAPHVGVHEDWSIIDYIMHWRSIGLSYSQRVSKAGLKNSVIGTNTVACYGTLPDKAPEQVPFDTPVHGYCASQYEPSMREYSKAELNLDL